MKLLDLSDAMSWLPSDCLYAGMAPDPEKRVLLHEGDWTTDRIDLDAIHWEFPELAEGECIAFIIVTGNLVASRIYNAETESSCGLVVLGNVRADDIVVGGQVIHVAGALAVSGLYWGDYNHGCLQVDGPIAIRIFMATNEYEYDQLRFDRAHNVQVSYRLLDYQETAYTTGNWLRALMQPAMMESAEDVLELTGGFWGWGEWLETEALFKALAQGHPIVLPEAEVDDTLLPPSDVVPFLFEDKRISLQNLRQFAQHDVLYPYEDDPQCQILVGLADGIARNVVVRTQPLAGGAVASVEVSFETDDGRAYVVREHPQQPELAYRLTSESAWMPVDRERTPQDYAFIVAQWRLWQQDFSTIVHRQRLYRRHVTQEKVAQLLALPVIRDNYSLPEHGNTLLWLGSLAIRFHQATDTCVASIMAAKPLDAETDDFDFLGYEVDPEREHIVLCTQDGNGSEFPAYEVPWCEAGRYSEAMHRFDRVYEGFMERKPGWYPHEA